MRRYRDAMMRKGKKDVFLPLHRFLTSSLPHVCLLLLAALSLLQPFPAEAAAPDPAAKQASHAAASADEPLSFTHHTISIDGEPVAYTAVAGRLTIRDDAGKARAHVFFTSYTREGATEGARRPVTFCFNGGPGAASVFLHMAAVGPALVVYSGEGKTEAPPYRWVPNPHTWLGFTDLVFVDPVGTGYSRTEPGVDAKEFFGVRGDTLSMAQFIRGYCTRFDRWLSPKFILGESYGTTRAAALAGHLMSVSGLTLNGLVLISSALDFQTFSFVRGNDLPYILYLPAYACAAWYHGKTDPSSGKDLAEVRRRAEEFAAGDYLRALMKGDALDSDERNRIAGEVSRFTGLPVEYVNRTKLRIERDEFLTELLKSAHLTMSVLDSRRAAGYTVRRFLDDPGMFYLLGPLSAGWNDYVRKVLRYESPLRYEVLLQEVNSSWDWGSASGGFVNEAPTLSDAMKKNRSLKVFLASGYFDLDTSYFSAIYTMNHLGLDKDLRANITMAFYEAGHQVYTDPPSRERLYRDVKAFYEKAPGVPGPRR